MAPEVVLAAREIVAGYGDLDILQGVSVDVRQGEIVTIIGPNGAGKSTLLKAVFGLLQPRAGTVTFLGRDVTRAAPDALVQAGLGYVPQINNVFPNLTVRENLEMGAFVRTDPAAIAAAFARVHALFPVLQEREREKVGRFSGGQRQMVAMGRALMADPKLLLLDEPSAGLAPNLVDAVFANIREVARAGVPVLLVEQNARRALALSDRGYVLDQGRNKYEGTGREILEHPELGKLYLGGR